MMNEKTKYEAQDLQTDVRQKLRIEVDIIMQSKEYTSKMDAIMRALYIGEYVIVHQDVAGETIDRTGEISYIHPHKTYFNVKFGDTGVQESYYPSDVLTGTVIL